MSVETSEKNKISIFLTVVDPENSRMLLYQIAAGVEMLCGNLAVDVKEGRYIPKVEELNGVLCISNLPIVKIDFEE